MFSMAPWSLKTMMWLRKCFCRSLALVTVDWIFSALYRGSALFGMGNHLLTTWKDTLSVAPVHVLDCFDNQWMMFRLANYIPSIDPFVFLWEGFCGMHLNEFGLERHGEIWVVF
jgi:hypothetical protein